MDDSAITCDDIAESNNEERKSIPRNCNEQMQNFYNLLAFLLLL